MTESPKDDVSVNELGEEGKKLGEEVQNKMQASSDDPILDEAVLSDISET